MGEKMIHPLILLMVAGMAGCKGTEPKAIEIDGKMELIASYSTRPGFISWIDMEGTSHYVAVKDW